MRAPENPFWQPSQIREEPLPNGSVKKSKTLEERAHSGVRKPLGAPL